MKTFNELVGVDAQRALRDDQTIRQIISRIMPAELLDHVQFCRIENRVLKLTLDNASLLARLRFSASQIIDELNRDGLSVVQATWHVAPEKISAEPRAQTLRKRARSTASASIVQATAESMEDDDLQRALLKVAEQLAKRP